MPIGGNYSNQSALFQAVIPSRSYAQISARKDRELQYATYLAEQATQDREKVQQNIQLRQQQLNKLRMLPMEAPDKQRIRSWIGNKEAELAKHIETNYAGDVRKFMDVEGRMWTENALSDFLASDLYLLAEKNKQNVEMFRTAAQKGDNVIGEVDEAGNYISAEKKLLDYMNGTTPTYSFSGSYKPKTGIYEYAAKMDNPYGSRYDANASMSETDKLSYLQSEMGDRQGMDMYYRNLKDRRVPFKRYSLEDQVLYNLGLQNTRSQISARERNLAIAQGRLDLARNKQTNESGLIGMVEQVLSAPIETTAFAPYSGQDNQISALGVGLSDLVSSDPTTGNPGIAMRRYSDLTLGSDVNKMAGITPKGKVKEVVTIGDGGRVRNFSNVPHQIRTIKPGILVDENEDSRAAREGREPNRVFREVSIAMSLDAAEAQGLYNDRVIGSGLTEEGKKMARELRENGKVKQIEIDVLVPVKSFFENPEVRQRANKAGLGQKAANDLIEEYLNDAFSSASDSILDQ